MFNGQMRNMAVHDRITGKFIAWRPSKYDEPYGAVRALDIATSEMKWEFRLKDPLHAGLMTTAGHIVANPVSYQVDGKQYVAISAKHSLCVFALD